jgi:hypothetical protein
MDGVLSTYIKVITKIFIFSILALIVFWFSNVAYDSMYYKQNLNAVTSEMREHEEIRNYLTSETITGDDLIIFVANFRRNYDIVIKQPSKSDYELSKWNGEDVDWQMENVIDIIGANTSANFEVIPHYDNNDEITEIEFDMQ